MSDAVVLAIVGGAASIIAVAVKGYFNLRAGQTKTHEQLDAAKTAQTAIETTLNGKMAELVKMREDQAYARGAAKTTQEIYDLMPSYIVEVSARTLCVVRVNRAAMWFFGYNANELVGHPLSKLIPIGMGPAHEVMMRKYIEDPTIRPMGVGRLVEARKRSGEIVHVEVLLGPHLEAGEPHVIAIIRKAVEGGPVQFPASVDMEKGER